MSRVERMGEIGFRAVSPTNADWEVLGSTSNNVFCLQRLEQLGRLRRYQIQISNIPIYMLDNDGRSFLSNAVV